MKNDKQKKHLSINAHVFLSMVAVALALVAILWILQIAFTGLIYKSIKTGAINKASETIATNIDSENLEGLISQVAISEDLCVKVIDLKNGDTEIYDEHFHNDCIIHKITDYDELIGSWYNNAEENSGFYTTILPREMFRDFEYDPDSFKGETPEKDAERANCIISIRLVVDENGSEHMILSNTSVEPLDSTVKTIRIMLLVLTIIAVVVSLIASYILSKRISTPISKINTAAKSLSDSNFKTIFKEEGPKEVRELASTLNETAAQLAQLDRMQKELIANISHDLRTPLTMISGYSEVMRDIPGENTPENIQVIIDETARLNSLVSDLLNVSKLQSGTQIMDIRRVSLTKIASETVSRFERLVSHNGYKVEFSYDKEVFIEADETRLLQVVYNLITNAINYTGEDKTVKVVQSILDNTVRISVIDSGEGISEENLPLIWDRYYKIDKVHKRAIMGTGLGLSIVKNILLLHDSRFGVSSEIGKGSTFWFEFKIVD